MIASVVVDFRVEKDISCDLDMARGAHALFLNIIRNVDEELAAELHDNLSKPFTISLINQCGKNNKTIKAGNKLWIRFTFLKEIVYQVFMKYFLKNLDKPLMLGNGLISVAKIQSQSDENSWCRISDYNEILENTKPFNIVRLQFVSPTTFKTGEIHTPMPIPSLIFKSLLDKWNEFSDYKIDEDIINLTEQLVAVSRYDLKTKLLTFKDYNIRGFVGDCEFKISKKMPEYAVMAINILSDFSYFSGIGYKTTMGLGQCLRIK